MLDLIAAVLVQLFWLLLVLSVAAIAIDALMPFGKGK